MVVTRCDFFSGQERKDFYENKASILSNWLDDDEDTETHSNFIDVMFACLSTTKQTSTTSYKIMSKYL